MLRLRLLLPLLLLPVVTVRSAAADEAVDFNRDVRPILARNCFRCHGTDAAHREAGLRLDERDAALAELDSGAIAIVPGDAAASELVARITADDDDLRMPPVDSGLKLDADQIALLRRWVEQGAVYAPHWSFVPPRRPPLPDVDHASWSRNPIDRFIVARLAREGLEPSPPATRYALVRRLSLDLRGLPPTIEEVRSFADDPRPDAYERLVDRLLDDPAFGERWARLWLDLARYADSRGYGSDPLRPNMWRYRDWVIDAFNRNLPYDQFTVEQLAGDLLPDAALEQRVATAFHRNTMTNTEGGTDDEEFRVAAVKDRAETTIKVWMGLTMQCANCHDHKFDPISQREYYRLYAVFNQTADTDRPDEAPTIEAPTPLLSQRAALIDANVAALRDQIAVSEKQVAAEREQAAANALTGRVVRIEIPGRQKILSLAEVQVFGGQENWALAGTASQSSVDYDGPAALAIDGNTDGHYFDAKSTTHTKTEDNPWWQVDLGADRAVDRIVVWNRTDGEVGKRLVDYRVTLRDAAGKTVWEQAAAKHPAPSSQFQPRALTARERQIAAWRDELARLEKSRPELPTLPVMQELPADQRRPTYFMIKGNFLNHGEQVEPGLPAAFHPPPEGFAGDRRDVARWLTDEANPLTARVAVNRMWAQLFGAGLVETEEDFGTQGEPPSHPQLLDWLATEYVRVGWDTKRMLKTIVTSATYRQSARVTPERLERDPRNRLLSRAPRYRLEAEMVRDQALALAGLLSTKLHGPSVYPFQPPGLWRAAFNGQRTWPVSQGEDRLRRGLYTFWRRTVPYPSMQTFDAPSREICTVRRIRTNTPLQAFVALNDPVYVEAAQGLARRLIREGGTTPRQRAGYGLQLCLARPPGDRHVDVLVKLFESQWEHYRGDPQAALQLATDPIGPLPAGWDAAEVAAWTVVANVLLNLDGVLTRG